MRDSSLARGLRGDTPGASPGGGADDGVEPWETRPAGATQADASSSHAGYTCGVHGALRGWGWRHRVTPAGEGLFPSLPSVTFVIVPHPGRDFTI